MFEVSAPPPATQATNRSPATTPDGRLMDAVVPTPAIVPVALKDSSVGDCACTGSGRKQTKNKKNNASVSSVFFFFFQFSLAFM